MPRWLSWEARSLLSGLIQKDPTLRLGYGPDGTEDIKRHAYFASLDWDRVYKKEVTPEFIPEVGGLMDVKYFDETFTKEAVVDSVVAVSAMTESKEVRFENFTYVKPTLLSSEGERDVVDT
jgi:hypothetical protein